MIECADQLIKLSKGRPVIISLPRKTDIYVNVHLKPDCIYFNGRYPIIIIYSTTILLNQFFNRYLQLIACNQTYYLEKMSLRVDRLIHDRLYSAILRSLEQTHCARMWFYMSD